MLPPDDSWWICRRDRRTDGRTPDRYITLSARRGQRDNALIWTVTTAMREIFTKIVVSETFLASSVDKLPSLCRLTVAVTRPHAALRSSSTMQCWLYLTTGSAILIQHISIKIHGRTVTWYHKQYIYCTI